MVMQLQYLIFTGLNIVLSAVLIVFIVLIVRKGDWKPTTMTVFLFLLCSLGFLLGAVFEFYSKTVFWSKFWGKLNYFFIVFIPVLWLRFSILHSSPGSDLPVSIAFLLLIIPVATILMLLNNSWSFLMWSEITEYQMGKYLVIEVEHGPWFWIYAIYSYSIVMLGVIILLRSYIL